MPRPATLFSLTSNRVSAFTCLIRAYFFHLLQTTRVKLKFYIAFTCDMCKIRASVAGAGGQEGWLEWSCHHDHHGTYRPLHDPFNHSTQLEPKTGDG